jgi:hypothetical protein
VPIAFTTTLLATLQVPVLASLASTCYCITLQALLQVGDKLR